MTAIEFLASRDLESALTIRTVGKAHQTFLDRLQRTDALRIDLPAEFEIDLAGVQLILAARSYAYALGKSFSLERPAEGQLLEVLLTAGITSDALSEERAFWLHEQVTP